MKSMKEMIQEWDIKEILNEGADLNVPVKMAKKSLSKLALFYSIFNSFIY